MQSASQRVRVSVRMRSCSCICGKMPLAVGFSDALRKMPLAVGFSDASFLLEEGGPPFRE